MEADGEEFFFLAPPLLAELAEDQVGLVGGRRRHLRQALPDDDPLYSRITPHIGCNRVGRSLRADGEDAADFSIEIIRRMPRRAALYGNVVAPGIVADIAAGRMVRRSALLDKRVQ